MNEGYTVKVKVTDPFRDSVTINLPISYTITEEKPE